MKNRRYTILAIILVILLVLPLIDYLNYRSGKEAATEKIKQLNLNLQNNLISNITENSKCYGTKVLASISYGCSARMSIEYKVNPSNSNNLLQLVNYFEDLNWNSRGTTKHYLVYEQSESNSPHCAQLYNDQKYPAEEVRLNLCRNDSSSNVTINAYSRYRPSLIMMLYLGIKAQNQVQ